MACSRPRTKISGQQAGISRISIVQQVPLTVSVRKSTLNRLFILTIRKTFLGDGDALTAPSRGFIYDWNLLPIGQLLWLKKLETHRTFPSPRTPASYPLDQVIAAMQDAKHICHAGHKPSE